MMDYSLDKAMRHLSTLPCPCQKCKARRMAQGNGCNSSRPRAPAGNGEPRGAPPEANGLGPGPGPERDHDNDHDNDRDRDPESSHMAPYGTGDDTNRTEPGLAMPQQAATSGFSGVPISGGINSGAPREYRYSGSWAVDTGYCSSPRRVSRGLIARAGIVGHGQGLRFSEDAYTPSIPPDGYRPPHNSITSNWSDSRQSHSHTSLGFDVFGNERINQILTFIVEILGVLVFFAICTISFWITLGYYVVKLCLDFKAADKWVKTAAGILVGLLLIAFLVTVVTDREGRFCCPGRARAKSKWIPNCCPRVKGWFNYFAKARPAGCKSAAPVRVKAVCPKARPPACSKWSAAKLFSTFKSMIWPQKCKPLAATCPNAKAPSSTFLSMIWPKTCPNAKPPACSKCDAGQSTFMSMIWPQKCKPLPGKKPIKCWLGKCEIKGATCPKKVRYTDQQGRAIFLNSKRYAIPCEMKQPPAVFVWLFDMIVHMWGD